MVNLDWFAVDCSMHGAVVNESAAADIAEDQGTFRQLFGLYDLVATMLTLETLTVFPTFLTAIETVGFRFHSPHGFPQFIWGLCGLTIHLLPSQSVMMQKLTHSKMTKIQASTKSGKVPRIWLFCLTWYCIERLARLPTFPRRQLLLFTGVEDQVYGKPLILFKWMLGLLACNHYGQGF